MTGRLWPGGKILYSLKRDCILSYREQLSFPTIPYDLRAYWLNFSGL
jgi:hypothetical protein